MDDHECDENGNVDIDLCGNCKEHASFCSVCGASSCCGAGAVDPDPDIDKEAYPNEPNVKELRSAIKSLGIEIDLLMERSQNKILSHLVNADVKELYTPGEWAVREKREEALRRWSLNLRLPQRSDIDLKIKRCAKQKERLEAELDKRTAGRQKDKRWKGDL